MNRLSAVAACLLVLAGACSVEPPTAADADPFDPEVTPTEDGVPATAGRGFLTGLAGHRATGSVAVTMDNGVATITLEENVTYSGVPDPWLYLGTTRDANQNALRIRRLTSSSGPATYRAQVPPGVAYPYVLIWCDRYNVGVGVAQITPSSP